jgi:hypothetical protein
MRIKNHIQLEKFYELEARLNEEPLNGARVGTIRNRQQKISECFLPMSVRNKNNSMRPILTKMNAAEVEIDHSVGRVSANEINA